MLLLGMMAQKLRIRNAIKFKNIDKLIELMAEKNFAYI